MSSADVVQSAAAVATAMGVAVAAAQLLAGARQRRGEFEQRLNVRYEQIQARIALKFLIDDHPYDRDDQELRRAMFDYFELCEEELYFVEAGRATQKVLDDEWIPGIKANMQRPAFKGAWADVSSKSTDQFTRFKVKLGPEVTDRIADAADPSSRPGPAGDGREADETSDARP